ncbi:MAG: dual specificity protein phosphatase family protein [Proteobacteria bacterium]|nr:dual specificity protein phosphatase family protein [Pseudomonadota bacterium]
MSHGPKLGAAGVLGLVVSALLPLAMGLFLGFCSAVTLIVGLATWTGATGLLGKRADGGFPAWSFVLFPNWHAMYRVLGRGVLHPDEPRVTEVHPGWFVGGWPSDEDWPTWPAVVDVACELPRRGPLTDYLYVPTWDRMPPSADDLRQAATFAVEKRAEGRPVLIHCVQGHGRSVTVLSAALVQAGLHDTWAEAFAHIQSVRPRARLSNEQSRALDAWAA